MSKQETVLIKDMASMKVLKVVRVLVMMDWLMMKVVVMQAQAGALAGRLGHVGLRLNVLSLQHTQRVTRQLRQRCKELRPFWLCGLHCPD
jgi:hypothetical protein